MLTEAVGESLKLALYSHLPRAIESPQFSEAVISHYSKDLESITPKRLTREPSFGFESESSSDEIQNPKSLKRVGRPRIEINITPEELLDYLRLKFNS